MGVTPTKCKEKGCCWKPSSIPDKPWCFHSKGLFSVHSCCESEIMIGICGRPMRFEAFVLSRPVRTSEHFLCRQSRQNATHSCSAQPNRYFAFSCFQNTLAFSCSWFVRAAGYHALRTLAHRGRRGDGAAQLALGHQHPDRKPLLRRKSDRSPVGLDCSALHAWVSFPSFSTNCLH